MRELLQLCFIATLLLALAGCQFVTSTPTPSPTPSPSPTPTVAATPSPTPTIPRGLTTIELWVPDFLAPYDETNPDAALLVEQIESFSRNHRDIQVELLVKKAKGAGGLYDLLSAGHAAAPSVLPDVILLDETDLRSAADEGLIQPLPDLNLSASTFPFATRGVQMNSTTYGIPFLADIEHMVYNPGVGARPPLSWTAVLSEGYSLLIPAAPLDGLAGDFLLTAYLGSGGAVVDEEGNPVLERARLEELYGFLDSMVEANTLDPEIVMALADPLACWAGYQERLGSLSVVPAGTYWRTVPRIGESAWIPTRDGAPAAVAHFWSFAIVATEPHRQEASLQLASWLSESQQMADLSISMSRLPTTGDALSLWTLSSEENEFLTNLLMIAEPGLPATIDQPIRRGLQEGLALLLESDDATPEEAASRALTALRR